MRTPDSAVQLIKNFEAFRAEWYQCSANVWTIGFGHAEEVRDGTVTGEDLPEGFSAPLTRGEAEELLVHYDLPPREACVADAVDDWDELTPNQFGALVSFTYNVGCGALRDSTLLDLVSEERFEEAADELVREEDGEIRGWIYVDGDPLDGLIRRREAEKELFLERADRALDIEPVPLDPLPIRDLPVSVDVDDPTLYGID